MDQEQEERQQQRQAHPLDRIRTERSGVTEALPHHKRALLLQGMQMSVVDVIYDLIEAECVKQETKMLNLEPHQREQIQEQWRLSKAFWQIFVGLQRRVQKEITDHLGQQVEAPEVTDEQKVINEVLDATLGES